MPVLTALALLSFVAARGARSEGGATSPPIEPWARVLERFQHDGGVDYAALAADRGDLDAYLDSLAAARPESWPVDEQNAFWMNAYNAVVLDFVLAEYPDLESVRDVPGFFDKRTFPVAGKARTLDEIETASRDLGDPRVHFAVVCASTSCPDLPAEPLAAAGLDEQLENLTRRFLSQPEKGLTYDADENELWLSSIFKWYAGDFTGGSTVMAFFMRSKVVSWLLPHLPASLRSEIETREPSVSYLDYDWSLNDRPR